MRRTALGSWLGALLFAVAVWPAQRVLAEDETDDLQIEVQAPLEAVSCAAVPPTIGVLGLTIDVSAARFGHDEDGDDQGEDRNGDDDGEDDDEQGGAAASCADLAVGQLVKVTLSSDVPDPMTGFLSAVEVELETGGKVEIQGPLQAVDPNAPSVTVLGLIVDIHDAEVEDDHGEAEDDEHDEGVGAPIDPIHLMVGQTVELELVSSQPPLTANSIEVKNFDNEVEIHLKDGNADENDDEEVEIEIMEKVVVHAPAAPGKHAKKVKMTVQMHATGS